MKAELQAISVWQPYAWLLAQGLKPYENRTRNTGVRGWVLIHASTHKVSRADWASVALFVAKHCRVELPLQIQVPRAAYVGAMRIDGVATEEHQAGGSPWFSGPFGLRIGAAVAFREPVPGKGRFDPRNETDFFPVTDPQLELDILRELCRAGVAREFGYDTGGSIL